MREATRTYERQHCRQLPAYVLPGRLQRKWETLEETTFVCYNLLLADLTKNVHFNRGFKVLLLRNHDHLF